MIKFMPNRFANKASLNDYVIIVSGLPRCGTSMMMQMLEVGGLPVVTDYIRKADEDNPLGYYEFEKVKKLKEDASWLEEYRGKVLKMISVLLFDLPQTHRYKIIFMKRILSEMVASQNVMLQRRGQKVDSSQNDVIAAKLRRHLAKVEEWLASQPNMEVAYINYNEVIKDPLLNAERINRFMDHPLDVARMVGVVRRSLYRNRESSRSAPQ